MRINCSVIGFIVTVNLTVFVRSVFCQVDGDFGYAILYSNQNYKGAAHQLLQGDEVEDLRLLGNGFWPQQDALIGSIELHGVLELELWDQPRFQGNAITVTLSQASLESLGSSDENWQGRVKSVRVISLTAPEVPAVTPPSPVQQPLLSKSAPLGEVRVYTDAGFTGDSFAITQAQVERNLNYVANTYRGWNDKISSIHIKGDFSVVLYKDAELRGNAIRIDESVANLRDLRRIDPADGNWNDTVSSFEVLGKNQQSNYSRGAPGYAATLYEDENFQGQYVVLHDGQKISNLRDKRMNDSVSSIMVSDGYKVILYEHDNFSGSSIELDRHQTTLKGFPGRWNDKATSLMVIKK